MTKDEALKITNCGSQYFIQSFIIKNGDLQLLQTYGPFDIKEVNHVKSMNASQRGKFKKKSYISIIKNKECMDCGVIKSNMTFDHVKGKKSFDIAGGPKHSWVQLFQEISKCEVVCRSCHNVREYLRGVFNQLTEVEDLAELLVRVAL